MTVSESHMDLCNQSCLFRPVGHLEWQKLKRWNYVNIFQLDLFIPATHRHSGRLPFYTTVSGLDWLGVTRSAQTKILWLYFLAHYSTRRYKLWYGAEAIENSGIICKITAVSLTASKTFKEMFSEPTVTSAQTEDSGLGPPVKGVKLVFLWVIFIFSQSPDWFLFQLGLYFVWDGEVGSRELCCCLPICLQYCFRQCQHELVPTGAILCCCWTENTGCCVAAGLEGQWSHSWESEEQTGSQRAGHYSAGCSLPQSGVLWQFSGHELLLCSWSSDHLEG